MVEEVLDSLNIPQEKRAQFFRDHDFSQGYYSLDFAIPAPAPLHTFDEGPLIKEADDPEAHREHQQAMLREMK